MSCIEPKKRGRRKKIVDPDSFEEKKKEETNKRSKKQVKIVNALALTEMIQSKNVNVILHLKCSVKDINDYYQKTISDERSSLKYLPNVPCEIQAFDENTNGFTLIQDEIVKPAYKESSTNFVCPVCDYNVKKSDSTVDENELYTKLKDLKLQFFKNEVDKKSACFWCTYPFDSETCYILKHGSLGEIQGHGSFCSPECSVAYLYNNMTWDDSAKIESYQLINNYYGKPNGFEDNIKPAASPYYFLEKFYGNMDIQEYRRLSKSNHMLLTVDKPITRILPEIHEDSDRFFMQNNTQIRGNYKVKKQSDKSGTINRNSILRDSFGLSSA